jgi:hypothetical protein
MHVYLSTCRLAKADNMLTTNFSGEWCEYMVKITYWIHFNFLNTGSIESWLQSPDLYSLADLVSINNGRQNSSLSNIYETCDEHIRNCEVCIYKVFIMLITNTSFSTVAVPRTRVYLWDLQQGQHFISIWCTSHILRFLQCIISH